MRQRCLHTRPDLGWLLTPQVCTTLLAVDKVFTQELTFSNTLDFKGFQLMLMQRSVLRNTPHVLQGLYSYLMQM